MISQILLRIPGVSSDADPETVSRRSNGNPGRAVQLWRTLGGPDDNDLRSFEWFRRQLKPLEKHCCRRSVSVRCARRMVSLHAF